MKIEYELVRNYYGGFLCPTTCPNNMIENNVVFKVGSDSCRECKYYVEDLTYKEKNILVCSYKEEKNETRI